MSYQKKPQEFILKKGQPVLLLYPVVRAAPGTPAYKSPEEYYDEVLELRKQIGGLDKDNSVLRAKLRRTEEDNLKKEKQIETLMDPTKVCLPCVSLICENASNV